jgi:hypothetical protein
MTAAPIWGMSDKVVHVLAPRPPAAILPVFLNVDRRVGQSDAAAVEDVLLVQFALHKIGENIGALPAFWAPIFLKVPITGHVDSNTVDAIRTFQRGPLSNVQDSRMSCAALHGSAQSFSWWFGKIGLYVTKRLSRMRRTSTFALGSYISNDTNSCGEVVASIF